MTDESRGKRLGAQRLLLFWIIASFACMGATGSGLVPESHLSALAGLYTSFTWPAVALAATLWGLDAAGAQIIPAMRR